MIRVLVLSAVLGASAAALCQDRPDDEIVILRNQLHAVQGVSVRMGGIDTIAAMRLMTDRLIDIDQRLERLERK